MTSTIQAESNFNISLPEEEEDERQRKLELSTVNFNNAFELIVATSQLLQNTDSPACDAFIDNEETTEPLNTDIVGVIHQTVKNINNICYLLSTVNRCKIKSLLDALKSLVVVVNELIAEHVQTISFELPNERDYAKIFLYKIQIQELTYGIVPAYQSILYYRDTRILENSLGSLRNLLMTRANIEKLLTPKVYHTHAPANCLTDLKMMSIVHESLPDDDETATCPICFDDKTKGQLLRTNCSHGFCIDCMLNYTESIKTKKCKPTCPCCRTVVVEVKSGNTDICQQFITHITNIRT